LVLKKIREDLPGELYKSLNWKKKSRKKIDSGIPEEWM
jgi:hypothetical protein